LEPFHAEDEFGSLDRGCQIRYPKRQVPQPPGAVD